MTEDTTTGDGTTPATTGGLAPATGGEPTPVNGALDLPTLQRALEALATGDRAAAEAVLAAADLDEDARRALTAPLQGVGTDAEAARELGEALRRQGLGHDLVNEAYRAAFYLSGRSEVLSANPLYAYFLAHRSGGALDKWVHYFPVYHRHLERFRDRPVRVLEIGVYRGGGLAMWQHYLGPEATVVGLDVDPAAKDAAGPGFTVELGDQADPEVLRRVHARYGPFDVVIDDGGHTMVQQRTTVETLFPLLAEDGVLLVEDCHTSYWPEYEGGRGRAGTFVEWVKDRLDDLHANHTDGADATTVWATHLDAVHVHDSLVVLDKKERFRPFSEMAGTSAYLRVDRPAEGHLLDLIAARDAARAEVEALEAELAELAGAGIPVAAADPTAEELRRTRSALRQVQSQLAETGAELSTLQSEVASTNGRLLESWEQIHLMRKSVSWRLTAPLRAVRGMMK